MLLVGILAKDHAQVGNSGHALACQQLVMRFVCAHAHICTRTLMCALVHTACMRCGRLMLGLKVGSPAQLIALMIHKAKLAKKLARLRQKVPKCHVKLLRSGVPALH